MAVRLQFRRGTLAEWTSANPILKNGELVFETDTYQAKVGDGVTAYISLPYCFAEGFTGTLFDSFF
jgi:hypothetical protein